MATKNHPLFDLDMYRRKRILNSYFPQKMVDVNMNKKDPAVHATDRNINHKKAHIAKLYNKNISN